RISGNNFRAVMFVNVGLLAAAAAFLIWAASSTNRRAPWTHAFYPLVLMHWGHAENFLWAWQIGFTSAVFVVLLWLAFLVRAAGRGPEQLWGLAIIAILLPLCGGVGMCFLPLFVVWLLCRALSANFQTPADRYWALAGASAGLLMAALYFRGYTIEHSPPAS